MPKRINRAVLLSVVIAWGIPSAFGSEGVRDEEAATHSNEAAEYQLVDEYEFPGFRVAQYDLAVLSHFSYMLYSGGECLVVDPGRDIETYVQAAEKAKAKIVGVWLTHSHADFVAGHIEFAKQLNVPLRISKKAHAGYEHIGLEDNDTLAIGDSIIKFLETPGHTPDSMCGVVSSKRDPGKPLALLTGDTLFIGSVGRPDLLGEGMAASTLASMMFDSWTLKLSKLPDEVLVLPAHGAGSLCGAHLSDSPVSTLGEQRASNSYLQYTNRGEFVAAILNGLPEAPQYFAHNAAMNRIGPEPIDWSVENPPLIEPSTDLTDPTKYYVVDIREAQPYAKGHIPNSVNIALRGRLENWTGTMVPWGSNVVITGSGPEICEARRRLHRVGYTAQCLPYETWERAGMPIAKNAMITPRQLHAEMQTAESPIVVDVRQPAEWQEFRIGTVLNIPLTGLSHDWVKLDRSQRVVAVCNSAYRSSMAVGLLERNGFLHASSMAGGGDAWEEAGLPFQGTATLTSNVPDAMGLQRLPEPIDATALNRLLLDLPDTFQLIDIRPASHFADYHLPGAENVAIADLMNNPAFLNGVSPLVIVDRDGSYALMLAGTLSQKTNRPIKALVGGLQRYWDVVGIGAMGRASVPMVAPTAPAPSTPRPSAPAAPPTKRRRSAGC